MSRDRFTAMRFILKHRALIVGALSALPLMAGVYLWLRTSAVDFALAGVVLTPVAWLIVRVLLELIDVVAETLIPR